MVADRTVASLVGKLEDAHDADAAGRSLLALGPAIVPYLLEQFASTPVPVRRRLAFLLGKFPVTGQVGARRREVLLEALNDVDWKVRRNAAVSLGGLAEPEVASPLLARLEIENHPAVRPSLMLAIGRTASAEDLPELRSVAANSQKEREAAAKMVDSVMGRAGIGSRVIADLSVPPDVTLELWTRAGVGEIAADEARALNLEAAALTPDRVRLGTAASFEALLRVRSALFPALVMESTCRFESPVDLGREFAASSLGAALRVLTDGEVTYRLTLEATSDSWPRRSDWIREFVSVCPEFENKATSYAWDVIVRSTGTGTILGARPAAIPDARFDYRLTDVPASIHPTLAAAAVRLVETSATDVVVDPFCGSGTLLMERAILGPYREMQGIDNDPRAIRAARGNLQGLTSVSLKCADYSVLSNVRSPSLILTNPPYGRRVSGERQAREIHLRLDELAARVLVPGGHLVAFRPVDFAAPRGLKTLSQRRVDAGGIAINLIVAQKQTNLP